MFPKLITRYVCWELTKIFLISSFGFVAFMLVVCIGDEARSRGLSPDILLQLIPYIIPEAVMFAIPATCLFSCCVVFGRLAADNELIAIQTMGLSKSVIILPAVAMAFMLSLFAVWINDVSFAWSYWGIEKVVLKSSDKIVYGILRNEGSFKTDKFSIEVQGVDGRKLIKPVIVINFSKDETIRVEAHEAELTILPEKHSLKITMSRGSVDREGQVEKIFFADTADYEVSLKSPEDIAKDSGSPTHLYLRQIKGEIDQQVADLERMNRENAVRACGQIMGGDMYGLTSDSWQTRMEDLYDGEKRLGRLHVVPHRRWANGFSCFAFAIIGIPVALRMKTPNYATTFGVCFLPILLLYYPLFMVGLDGAKAGTLPPYAAWLGNLACIGLGACLMYREFRR
ncbi:MAG: LptF/LptG family permease [Mariniblastus sp.]|nr:LptF/LptG family permease [Mariniblastus sp.]